MPINSVPNSQIIDVSTFIGSDTSKFQQAFTKACKDPFMTVYIPYTGRPWVIEDEIIAKSPANDYITFNVVGDPCWYLVDFKGKPGQTCFRFFGQKQSLIDSVMMRTWGDDLTGFSWEGDDNIRSCGTSTVRNCRVQFWQGLNGTAFIVGVGGDDYSASLFQQCEAYGDNGQFGSNVDPGYLKTVAHRNHRGFVFNIGNNLYQKLDSCRVVDCKVAVSQLYQGAQKGPVGSGGAGLVVDNFGTTACNLIFQGDGGFSLHARGGRHELGGALLSHGNPAGWQGSTTVVRLSDIVVDGLRPFTGAFPGGFEAGSIISCRSASKYRFEGMVFDSSNGEKLDGSAVLLAHSNRLVRADVSFQDCQLTFDPMNPKVVAGAWAVTHQSTKKVIGFAPSI